MQQGALIVQNPNALGSASEGTVVQAGAALELESSLNAEPITLNGDGIAFAGHNTGALRSFSNNNTYNGVITLNSNATIGVDSGSTLTLVSPGTIVDASNNPYSLTKELTGTLILQNANGNTGNTFINQGILVVQNSNALGAGRRQYHRSSTVPRSQLQDAGHRSQRRANRWSSANQTLSLTGSGINGSGALLNVSGSNSWQGPVTLDDNPDIAPVTAPSGTVVVSVLNAADTLTIGGAIGNTLLSGLKKTGAGTLALAGADTFSGTTEISSGYLRDQNAKAASAAPGNQRHSARHHLLVFGHRQLPADAQWRDDGGDPAGIGQRRRSIMPSTVWPAALEKVRRSISVTLTVLQATSPNPPGSSSPSSTPSLYVYTSSLSGLLGGPRNQPLIARYRLGRRVGHGPAG